MTPPLVELSLIIISAPTLSSHARWETSARSNQNNAKILWDKIKSTFTGQTEDRKIDTGNEFKNLQINSNELANGYIARARGIAAKCHSLGLDVSLRELVYYTVPGLKGKFVKVRDILKTQRDKFIDEVLEILREEETSFNSPSSTRAEGTSTDVFYSRKYKNSGMRLCYVCRRPNHVAKGCFYRNQKESTTSSQRRKVDRNNDSKERNTANPVFTASPNEESLCENIWILDSGASCHMAKDRIWFEKIIPERKDIYLAGKDSKIIYEGFGIVKAKTFTVDIKHISGKDNVVADAISRIESICTYPLAYEDIARSQQDDEELDLLLKQPTSLTLQKLQVPNTDVMLYCDISTKVIRPYIPKTHRYQVFHNLHDLAHPGVRKSKIVRHVHSPLAEFKVPNQRFVHINIDIIGPFPSSQGFTYCLTAIDRFSRWPEAMPIADIRAETVAQALYIGWISRFGVPQRISTDRGSQFTSDVFHSLAKTFGIRLSHIATYHPQANGAIERWHRTLKAAIMRHTSVHWVSTLPAVLLGLRTVFKEDLQCSLAEMVSLRATPTSNHSAKPTFIYRDLSVYSHVFLRVDAVQSSLSQPYTGPYKVLSRTNKNFSILNDNKKVTVTIDRLKPSHLLLDNVNSSESKHVSPGVDTSSPTPSAKEQLSLPEKSPILTRTGRRVHFPAKYQDFVS
ncbi:hypothetical protein AVEN_159015-1 [Araneus ventricosus]|uniref:Integrase catalytic domain-containing protein n=1 Tax=Araneus ventricosus TaxID=182803 RepID=A0A4Y2BCR8_ARAVE|nr:hypothetical protein AVEN_159015-1 [Araneus ventricosus]